MPGSHSADFEAKLWFDAKALKEEQDIAPLFAHPADPLIAWEQVQLMNHLSQSIKTVEKAVAGVADKIPCHQQLLTVPGV